MQLQSPYSARLKDEKMDERSPLLLLLSLSSADELATITTSSFPPAATLPSFVAL